MISQSPKEGMESPQSHAWPSWKGLAGASPEKSEHRSTE